MAQTDINTATRTRPMYFASNRGSSIHCSKMLLYPGLLPGSCWGSLQRSPDSLVGFVAGGDAREEREGNGGEGQGGREDESPAKANLLLFGPAGKLEQGRWLAKGRSCFTARTHARRTKRHPRTHPNRRLGELLVDTVEMGRYIEITAMHRRYRYYRYPAFLKSVFLNMSYGMGDRWNIGHFPTILRISSVLFQHFSLGLVCSRIISTNLSNKNSIYKLCLLCTFVWCFLTETEMAK